MASESGSVTSESGPVSLDQWPVSLDQWPVSLTYWHVCLDQWPKSHDWWPLIVESSTGDASVAVCYRHGGLLVSRERRPSRQPSAGGDG